MAAEKESGGVQELLDYYRADDRMKIDLDM